MALLPANITDGEIHSHQGLTYGGLVLGKKIKFNDTMEVFAAVLEYLNSEGIKKLHLKLMPAVYHELPSDEMEYLLFISEAILTRVDISSAVENAVPLKIQSNRMEGVKKAERHGLVMKEGPNFEPFWNEILIPNLEKRHGATPVHTLEEITRLAALFPKNIHQFNVMKDDTIVGGATLFESNQSVRVQYISGNEDKQQLGSLDFLFEELIHRRFKNKKYFDFGISNENQGKNINKGLLYWKETFGARSIACKFYTVQTANYEKFDSVFL